MRILNLSKVQLFYNYHDCARDCLDTNNCNWVTWNGDTKICVMYDSCQRFDATSCESCQTTDRKCLDNINQVEDSFINGVRCSNAIVTDVIISNHENNCKKDCLKNPKCLYFTFQDYSDQKQGTCTLYQECFKTEPMFGLCHWR